MLRRLGLLLVLCVALWSSSALSNPCVVPNVGVFDLSPANNFAKDYTADDGGNRYWFQPCMNTIQSCSSTNSSSPACQEDNDGNFHSLGLLSNQAVLPPPIGSIEVVGTVVYSGGEKGRSFGLNLACDHRTVGTVAAGGIVYQPNATYYFVHFNTSIVCLPPSGGSHVSGNIEVDTVWSAKGSPYYLLDDIEVSPGVKLVVESAVVQGFGNSINSSEGAIFVFSSEVSDVVFTWDDHSMAVENSTVTSCSFHGGSLQATSSTFFSSTFETEYQEFAGCSLHTTAGWTYDGPNGTLMAKGTTFNGLSQGFQVNASESALVSFHECAFFDNEVYNLVDLGRANINATDCWWGSTNITLIAGSIYSGNTTLGAGEVLFLPFLESPPWL